MSTWQNERPENMVHSAEREEARDAQRFASPFTSCYQHRFVSDGRGGGVCVCGDTIGADEL
jgi:hypothetical protein